MFTPEEKFQIRSLKLCIWDVKRFKHLYPAKEIKDRVKFYEDQIKSIKENACKRVW